MHGEELDYIRLAYDTNWMSTVGENINEVERIAAEKAEVGYAVGLACCTAALHLCVKLAGERLLGKPAISHGALEGRRVFCSDMTFDATLNPVVYEGGIPVFIDTEADSWNMDPVALEQAFTLYPEVKLVVMAHLYGFPAKVDEMTSASARLTVRCSSRRRARPWAPRWEAARQMRRLQETTLPYSYNGNKIITGSAGGCLLTNSLGGRPTAPANGRPQAQGERRVVSARGSRLQLPHEQCGGGRGARGRFPPFGGAHRPEKGGLRALLRGPAGSAGDDESHC